MEQIPPPVYVSVIFCREVLFDKNNMPTMFGVTNGITATPIPANLTFTPDEAQLSPIKDSPVYLFEKAQIAGMASFNCEVERDIVVSVRLRKPDGTFAEATHTFNKKMHLNAGDKGQLMHISTELETNTAGLFWFEIYVDEELRVKSPMRITHALPVQPEKDLESSI